MRAIRRHLTISISVLRPKRRNLARYLLADPRKQYFIAVRSLRQKIGGYDVEYLRPKSSLSLSGGK
jgi:hypothetical protein